MTTRRKKAGTKKDYKWLLLTCSMTIIFMGIISLWMEPLLKMWGLQVEQLKFLKESFPSGYVVITVGLIVELTPYIPEIIAVFKKK